MSLKNFLKENAVKVENIKVVVSDRFRDNNGKPIEWELKALTNKDTENLKKEYARVTWKRGIKIEDFDSDKFVLRCLTESIVYPNLDDTELQNSYGVMGAGDLLQEMLNPGEYANLINTMNEFNGFNKTFDERVDEAKN